MKEIQKQVAAQFKVSPDDVRVSVIDKPAVPGLTPFTASIDPKKLGRNASTSGVLAGTKLLTETAAMAAVAKAWGYGAKRTVSAVDVAKVFSKIHDARMSTSSILDADTLDVFKSTAHKEIAAAAVLPSEETVDGLPAVKYSLTGASLPFTVVTALFKPDVSVELRQQEIVQGGGGGRD